MPKSDKNEIAESLEDIESKKSIKKADSSKVLNNIKNLNVDLEDLEGFSPNISASIKQARIKEDISALNRLPYKMDVQLNDIIGKIFDTSHNYFIIVRDDKIIYANKSFLDAVDVKDTKDIYNDKFFKFIVKEDWNVLAKNIGEVLTDDISVNVRLNALNNRILPVQFKAIYLPDNRHFTFILMGRRFYEKDEAHGLLYDTVTGVPNYYLFEDRLQVAVNTENYSDKKEKDKIGVAVVSIDNFDAFVQGGRQNVMLRKMAEKLVFGLNKRYTIAVGIKYQFWILMPGIESEKALKTEVRKLVAIFEQAINDGIDELDIIASIGVSMFPEPANSAYKLMDNAIKALIKAKEDGGNKVVFILD